MASIGERVSGNGYIPLDGSVGNDALWEMRAKLGGFKSVMSLRFDEETCVRATTDLKKAVLPMLGDLKAKDVLEVGVGVGRFTSDLAIRARRVIGIDITETMLIRAQQAVTNQNVAFLRTDAISLPLADSSVDVLFELTVFQHIVDENDFRQAVKEAKRVLRAGGFMLLCGHLSPDTTTRKVHAQLVHRSFDAYINAVSPLEIVNVKHATCVDEDYSMMIVR